MIMGTQRRFQGFTAGLIVGAWGFAWACGSIGAETENLLANSSFEKSQPGPNGAEVPAAWSTSASWYAKPKERGLSAAVTDRTVTFVGEGAVRITGDGNRGVIWQAVQKGFGPGDTVELRTRVKVKELERGLAWLRAEFKGGGKILGAMTAHSRVQKTGTSPWLELVTQKVVPAETTLIQVFVCTSEPNSGTVWFDNASLIVTTRAAPQAQPTITQAPPPVPTPQPVTPKQTFMGLVPVNLFEENDVSAWRAGQWGRKPLTEPNVVSFRQDEASRYARMTFGTALSFLYCKWPDAGAWTALCFRARRVSGSGMVSILLSASGAGHFQHALRGLTKEWRDYQIPISAFLNDRNRKPLTTPRLVGTIRIFAHGKTAVDIGEMRLAVPSRMDLRDVYTDTHANVYEPGQVVQLKCDVINGHAEPTLGTLSWVLQDYRGSKIAEGDKALRLPGGSLQTTAIELPELGLGYYSCDAAFIVGTETSRKSVGVVIAPPRPAGAPNRPFVGFSAFGNIPELAVRLWMHRLEIPMNYFWLAPEAAAGNDSTRKLLALCKNSGVTPIGFFIIHPMHDRLSRGALVKSQRAEGKWHYNTEVIEKYIETVAAQFKNDIKVWSVAGEANLFAAHLEDGAESYIQASLASIRGIRRAVPDAKVHSLGMSGSDPYQGWVFAKHAWKTLGPHLDGIYSDNYPSGWTIQEGLRAATPESYLAAHLADILEHMGPGKTVGIEEAGYQLDPSVPVSHPLARLQAEYAARVALIAAAIPRCEEYHWYTLAKRSVKSPWGLCLTAGRHLNPSPGLATYATVARMLWDATDPVQLPLHRQIKATVYTKEQGAMAVLWSTAKDPISFAFEGLSEAEIVDADGAGMTAAEGHVFLSGSPIYVVLPKRQPERLVAVLKDAKFSLPPVKMAFVLDRLDSVKVLTTSQTPEQAVRGKVELNARLDGQALPKLPAVPLNVLPESTAAARLALPTMVVAANRTLQLDALFVTANGIRTAAARRFDLWPTKRLATPPTIDADLAEFATLTPVVLDQAENICPPDAVTMHKLWQTPEDLSARLWTAWDDQYVYVAADITDAVHRQDSTGGSIWRNDMLHIGFDMLNDTLDIEFSGKGGHDGKNDFEMGLALTKNGPEVHEWTSGAEKARGPHPTARLAVVRDDTHTRYELALPWRELGNYTPKAGRIFGFGFVIMNSNDGQTARYWLQFTRGICGGKDPSQYADFVLTE